MQRGRFCVTGFLRDVFTLRTTRGLIALFIVIAVHALGLTALTSLGIITPDYRQFAPAAVILGGFLFGIGIVLAGGCASGTWYRSGEGLIGSWIALATYGLSAAAMKTGVLSSLNDALSSRTLPLTTIPASLGTSAWPFALGFAAFTAWLAVRQLRTDALTPRPPRLAAKKKGLAHILTEAPWHVYATAVVVGALGVIAWPLSAATGRNDGLGITTPSANLFTGLVTGESARFDWGVMLVLGILVGAFIAARASGEFRLRVPDATQAARSVVGGVFMGVGAAWAGGCTVGNGMVQTSLFSYQGWVALLFIALGVGFAAKVWLRPTSASAQPEKQPVTEASSSPTTHLPKLAGIAVAQTGITVQRPTQGGLTQVGAHRWSMDTNGAVCPFPLIDARTAIESIPVGDELEIAFDCTQGTDTIPRWATGAGHEVTEFRQTDRAGWVIVLRKGAPAAEPRDVADAPEVDPAPLKA